MIIPRYWTEATATEQERRLHDHLCLAHDSRLELA